MRQTTPNFVFEQVLFEMITFLSILLLCQFEGTSSLSLLSTAYSREKYLQTLDLTFLLNDKFNVAARSVATEQSPIASVKGALFVAIKYT